MTLNIYRKKQSFCSLLLFDIYINGLKKSVVNVDKVQKLDLPVGTYSLLVKTSPLPDFYPSIIKVWSKLKPQPKSNHVNIEINKNNEATALYVVCGSWADSVAGIFKRWFVWLFRLITFKKKPHQLLLTKVSKEEFIQQKEKPVAKSKYLPKIPEAKRLILTKIILDVLMIPFGIYIYNQASGFAAYMGFILFLPIFGFVTQTGKFSNRVPSYKSLRSLSVLNAIILATIAYFTLNQPFIFGFSMLFLCIYGFVFFKAKTLFQNQKT